MAAKELLASNIKLLRKREGLSQERLAETAGVSAQTISDIEGCRTWVSDKTLETLAKALMTDVFRLFMPPGGDEGNNPGPLLYHRIEKLRSVIKDDIDKRLDQFFLLEGRS